MIALLVGRIVVRPSVRAKRRHLVREWCGSVAVVAHEFCWWPKGQIQDVVEDQHLPVTVGAGADADGRDTYFGGDHSRDLAGDALQVHASDTSAIKADTIPHKLLHTTPTFPPSLIT